MIRHLQVLLATLGDLFRSPLNSIMSALVIGITMAIPAIGAMLISSAESVSSNWDISPQINVYLDDAISSGDIDSLLNEFNFVEGIGKTKVLTKEQALSEFKQISGLKDELDNLDENPLPTTIIISPSDDYNSHEKITELQGSLTKIDGIQGITVNFKWLERLNSVLSFLHSIAKIISVLLAIAIILVVSNTIGLQIQNRKQEIVITKLVGATDSFVKRPFLYFGATIGILGGIFCCIIYGLTYLALNQPIQQLASSYGSSFSLISLEWWHLASLLLIGSILGWLAAQLSVIRHLSAIVPK